MIHEDDGGMIARVFQQDGITCPNCGDNHTHPKAAGTLIGHDAGESVAAYLGTVPRGRVDSRRSAVEVVFSCEGCPRIFSVIFRQHKGQTYIDINDKATVEGDMQSVFGALAAESDRVPLRIGRAVLAAQEAMAREEAAIRTARASGMIS